MIDWLESHMATCVIVKYLNIECPGCGIQRAFVALLKGEISKSIQLFPALLPYLATILLLIFQIIFRFKKGAYLVLVSFIVSVALMLLGYSVKLYHF